ncbi:putative adenine-specific DNA methyltransferase [Campylobacter iguaniorum]|uniref:Site-specific DNA-methyltransferase (adenine-specific) n=1 Tax=Campylobacter iguaniorum TaxID=1244531 RepID=A0A076F9C7_9BACT|nr:Dam family site-specific DNA-(adenine-N6)-methyltransferase [Campylobacter iguaniorum]AII14107.1 putative adenine-specific DNA methyltransferase [Campylobacter iguaniorum]
MIRSPLFYVGDKYKLMEELQKLFPKKIDRFIEPFVGGGSAFLNTQANVYLLNDIDQNIIKIHKFLLSFANQPNKLFDDIFAMINSYDLSCSYLGKTAPDDMKKMYIKTYYAKFNKQSYQNLKNDFNKNKNQILLLYILLIYGFNHMIRFNKLGDFNLPVGNVDFNKNVYKAINDYLNFIKDKKCEFFSQDYCDFLNKIDFRKSDFVYCDPPYLISNSQYCKNWNEMSEILLYQKLDELDKKNIKFGITNLLHHKGKTNTIFEKWSQKYKIYNIKSNYISFNDNTIKADSKELFVINL